MAKLAYSELCTDPVIAAYADCEIIIVPLVCMDDDHLVVWKFQVTTQRNSDGEFRTAVGWQNSFDNAEECAMQAAEQLGDPGGRNIGTYPKLSLN